MRINDLQVDGFGVWKGLTVDNLNPGMTLFYGRNEAGKTTLMQFVRSAMFGFSSERRDKYSPPVYGGIAGGEVHAITPIGNYVIQRHIDPNRINDEVGDLTVINDEDGTQSGKAQLGSLLANVDESIFNNVFAIGLKEIQELNTLNSTDAAEHLYKLTTGLDRVSLVDVMRTLTQRREAISASSDAPGRLKDLQQKRQVLQREIEDLLTLSRRWTKVAGQSKEATGRLQTLELQLKALERESKVIETATQISERWNQRELIIGQIDQVGILPDESLINLKELSRLNKKISQQKEKMTSVKKQRKAIRKEAFELPINRQLWAQASRIEALGEHLPWIESLERQADRLREQVKTIHSTIGGEVSGMGSTLSLTSKDVRALSNRGFQSLQATSKQLATKEEELSNAFEQLERVKLEKDQIASRVKSASAHLGKGLTREEAAKQVNRLRRRVELEEKVEKLNGARHALERDIDDVVNDQVLPVGKLAVLGAVFVLGVVLAGFGLLNLRWSEGIAGSTATEMGFLLMILGTIFGLFSMGLKHHWERVASDELDDFRHQFDLVRQQLKRAKNERDEIERHIPKGVGEWDLQLRDAESALTRLEDLMPLETHFQTAVTNVEESARRFQKLESDQEILQKQWKDNLRALGMPDNIAPNQLSELTQRTERINGFHSRLEQLEGEVHDREKELDLLSKRIDALLAETGVHYDEDLDPASRVQKLQIALGKQRHLVGQRKELATKFRNLRSTYLRADRDLEQYMGQKRRLLSTVGTDTDEQFRQLAVQHKQRHELIQRRDSLTEQIAAALGNQFEESQIGEYLELYGISGLESRWETTQTEIDERREEQSQLHQKRGEYLQEIKMLGEDARLDEARLELNAVIEEIADLKKEWQTLAVSTCFLDTIKETYEAKRQPETLLEASKYLKRLTEGQYTRIWTRLTGEELLVDNAQGETLAVEHLSRGTREAVYLGLRLALVDAYARRGAVLPMVLDDVLVNFDADRARAAAEVLRDFAAQGYQVLMFTCHDHIRDLFHHLDVDVRVLPHHRDVVDHNAIPTRLGKAEIATMPEPQIVEPIPVMAPESAVELLTDEYDPDLAFELSAVGEDQQRIHALDEPMLRLDTQQRFHDVNSTIDAWDPGIDISAQRSA